MEESIVPPQPGSMMLPQPPPFLPPALSDGPATVKVFGVMHLVFAGLGILGAASGLIMAKLGNPMAGFAAESPEFKAQMDLQTAMQDRIYPLTLTSSILSILVAVPMLIAGVKMLRKSSDGLAWSNGYAWSSLVAKVVNLILTTTIMIPAMNEMIETMTRSMAGPKSTPVPPAFLSTMSAFMAGGTIVGVLITCIYPVLTLVLLNRPDTKAWFASLKKQDDPTPIS